MINYWSSIFIERGELNHNQEFKYTIWQTACNSVPYFVLFLIYEYKSCALMSPHGKHEISYEPTDILYTSTYAEQVYII